MVIYDWSPSGANRALEQLMKVRGMLTDRQQVEHNRSIVRCEIAGINPNDLR